jgi:hypothetical protein
VREALDRHVRDRGEVVELDPVLRAQLFAIGRLERGLIGRQRRSERVVDQIEAEAAAGAA